MNKNERLKMIAVELRELAMQGYGNPTAVRITVDKLCDYADELERMDMTTNAEVRLRFFQHLWKNLQIIWPVASGLIGLQLALGAVIKFLERWSVSETIYFTFMTALTIGYGDLAPKRISSRMIALAIAFCGILLTGLVAALAVRSLQGAANDE